MTTTLINNLDLHFQLYDVLDIENLTSYPRFQDHSQETFNQALATAEKIAMDLFAPHNAIADQNEPTFDPANKKVELIPEVNQACQAFIKAGFMAACKDYEQGGMQLPLCVNQACFAYFQSANISTTGYPFLTIAAANLLESFGCDALKNQFLTPMLQGQYFGTMCLTEPHAGSSLGDIRTRAKPIDQELYTIKGQKIFISAGDHDLSENIVHFVLARIEGAPLGVKGISLFLVPKKRIDEHQQATIDNDVTLAGLFHKMGYRGTVSTALSFGENDECLGYLIGDANKGLNYMFQMMNEARLGVGMGATMIAYRGYLASLSYAKERPQGRAITNKDPSSSPVAIIEHSDIKRLLLNQKSVVEGAFSLCLYTAHLMDLKHLGGNNLEQQALIDLLTPIVKTWPSEHGGMSLSDAIQIHGGSGYTREYMVEQLYRDNRLNPIHEGTSGIQALDLLGRKVLQHQGLGFNTLMTAMHETIHQARAHSTTAPISELLANGCQALTDATARYTQRITNCDPEKSMANAYYYLDCLGTLVIAWMWLKQAYQAALLLEATSENKEKTDFLQGKIHTAQFFLHHKLSAIYPQLELFNAEDLACYTMKTDWF